MSHPLLEEITEEKFDVIIDIRYAGTNNFCGHKLYEKPHCYLHKEAASLLKKAVELAAKDNLRLKIWDCYRPLEVQQYMFNKFNGQADAAMFISDPKLGLKTHCRGLAIDLTLTDNAGNELDMATDFDEFSTKAFHGCNEISSNTQKNRIKLLNIMTLAGFNFIGNEWWHYQLFDPLNYDIIDPIPGSGMISQQVLDYQQ